MGKYTLLFFIFLHLYVLAPLLSQTVLEPGDIAVVGIVTDLSACGKPESDLISFVCFKDITSLTTIHLTDNGWEAGNPGFWGDSEGTLSLLRVGFTIPRGTVITLLADNIAGVWTYSIVSPDNNWIITETNIPGGPFNMENGGDQLYFLQGGVWDNQGGGMNQAIYSGNVLYGFNNLGTWAANGTTQQSNLHPSVDPCYYMSGNGSDFYKYTAPLTSTFPFDWLHRVLDPASWSSYVDCMDYASSPPNYANGFVIPIQDQSFGTTCQNCFGCPPYNSNLIFQLPPNLLFDIVYSDGTNTFQLFGIGNNHFVPITVNDTITYTLISATETTSCVLPPPYTASATFIAPNNNPGSHNTLHICPEYGIVQLPLFLGFHDPGGIWIPPLDPIFNNYYSSFWGPGRYYYLFLHDDCPVDSASIDVFWVDTAGTTIEIGCDMNGTPTDITDDRMIVTIFFTATGDFGDFYKVTPLYYGAPTGTITPDMGALGQTTVFTLDPGTATTNNMNLRLEGLIPFICTYKFPLPAPGYCSDPCDHDMTATLSGGGDICPNSCPDDPVTFDISIQGGHQFFTMDFDVSASGYPVWHFTNIYSGYNKHITVCIDDIAAPTFDEASGYLIIPKFLTGQSVTFTLANVYDHYGCLAQLINPDYTIQIHPLPSIATTSFSICHQLASEIDLTVFDPQISFVFDVDWYDGDPFNGGSEIYGPSEVNLHNVFELWAYVEDGYCGNSIQVPFTILPEPKLSPVLPIQVCEGNAVNLLSIPLQDLGNSMATYTYHLALPPDTTNQIDTSFFTPLDTTILYVLAQAGMCYDTIPIEIDVQKYPEFSITALPCAALANTYSVIFNTSADSIHICSGIAIMNPAGQDTIYGILNDSTVFIEILNSSGLCRDTIQILAPNCNCPLIVPPTPLQISYSICEGSPIPALSVNVGDGLEANWYDVISGGQPLLQDSLTFRPTQATSATYYIEAYDPSNGCYSLRTEITFIVHPLPLLQMLPDPVLCATEMLDFNSITPAVLNGVAGSGQWYNIVSQQPVTGAIIPMHGDSWFYVFTSNVGSCFGSDTISAIVNAFPIIDLFGILCEENTLTYNLAFTSDADIVLTSMGNLTQVFGTDSFLLTDIPYNADVQFDLQNTGSGCSTTFTQLAPDCSCPDLLINDNHQICSDQGNVDLSVFEGPGSNGFWEMVSTPSGSNPAVLAGNIFQGMGADEGLYILRFIRNVLLTDCVDTALFMLQLRISPFADAGTNGTSCAPDQILLLGTVGGSNVQSSWTTNGSGSILNPNSLNTGYSPTLADITAGSVTFTLNAVDLTELCPAATETITISIDGSAYYILNPITVSYCDTIDLNVDLDQFISFGNTSGHWFFPDTVSAPIVNSSMFNPITLQTGQYTVFYTTTNAVPPCSNDTTAINLVIEDCACPSVSLSLSSGGVCSGSEMINLNDFLITQEAGTWSIVNAPIGTNPAVIVGSVFVTNQSDGGIYRLRFTLSNPVVGCVDFGEINLDVIVTPDIQIVSVECADDLQNWEAIIITSAETVTGNAGSLISLGNNRYLFENIPANTTLQLSSSNGSGLCVTQITIPAPDCNCTLTISNLPSAIMLCPDDKTVLMPQVTGGKGAVTSFWIVNGNTINQTTLEINQAGSYLFVSTDSLGCREEHLVNVSLYVEMNPDASIQDITCPGDADGSILLHNILGGTGPYFISLSGGTFQPIPAFPYITNGLSAGIYQIEIFDALGCTFLFHASVEEVNLESLSLGPDQTLLIGDSVLISPFLSFTPDSFYWEGSISSIDQTKFSNWIKPEEDQYFKFFALDEKGCLYSDDLAIRVLLKSSIYVPSIFSPNEDGINDFIAPFTDPSVTLIEYFEIYSRWGELIFDKRNFIPHTIIGWDGMMNNQPVMTGVYVYRLSALNKKGTVLTEHGNITLIR